MCINSQPGWPMPQHLSIYECNAMNMRLNWRAGTSSGRAMLAAGLYPQLGLGREVYS